jgi:hypothetical protein
LYPITPEYAVEGAVVVVINVAFATASTVNNSLLASKVLPELKLEIKLVPIPKTVFTVDSNVLF